MKRPRDNRRKRLYRAEWGVNVPRGRRFKTNKAHQQYVNEICNAIDIAPITINWPSRRFVSSCAKPWSRVIDIGPESHRSELVTLHEIAHITQPPMTAWHGSEFIREYVRLVNWKMGRTAATKLAESITKHTGYEVEIV